MTATRHAGPAVAAKAPAEAKLSSVADKGFPWAPGAATGIGSMPGGNPMETARLVVDELPDFPFLAELPGRGPGADMIGRTAALLVDIPVEVTTGGWRIADRPGRDMRRARTMLSSDLDAMEETLDGYRGLLKVQLAGPFTLAATIEQPHSLKVALADPGLVTDIASSLAEAAKAHVAEVAKRVPGATLLVQLDEPALPAVAQGGIPTPSGLTRVREVDEEVLRAKLREVLTATRAYTIVHICAAAFPFGTIAGAGADAISFDLSLLKRREYDQLAEVAEAGTGLLLGFPPGPAGGAGGQGEWGAGAPHAGREPPRTGRAANSRSDQEERAGVTPASTAEAVRELWRRMGLPPGGCAEQVVITPACGLAGVSPQQARDALRRCREAAAILPEMMGELA
jgi:methionine synthase II (cobalamin-independent)